MPPSDRRVRRTEAALLRALLELMVEQGFDSVTVSQLVERADVGRSTFYAHYADKEDLLQGSIKGLHGYLQMRADAAAQSGAATHPVLAFCLPMLEHAHENRRLFAKIAGRPGGVLILELFHDMWVELVRAAWPEADEIAVQSIVGAFGSTMTWWLGSAPELSPEEVMQRYARVIAPTLPPR